jgi:transcriptional regulator with XRE-family HTH domain
MSSEPELDPASADYARAVGERLRAIRRQKRLSLQDAEELSGQEFKASVLGAYERGERAISVPRLRRLARVYQVPADQLLPRDDDDPRAEQASYLDLTAPVPAPPRKVVLDLSRLEEIGGPTGEMLRRYVAMIQLQRRTSTAGCSPSGATTSGPSRASSTPRASGRANAWPTWASCSRVRRCSTARTDPHPPAGPAARSPHPSYRPR